MRTALTPTRWIEASESGLGRLRAKISSLPIDRGIVLLAMLATSGAAVHFTLHGRARLVAAGVIVSLVTLLAVRRPRLGVLAVLTYLPLMGEIRRLLLYFEPWTGMDPLNLVAPAVAGLLLLQVFVGRNAVPLTLNARLVLALMVLMGLQVFNPLQGSPLVGLAGALFYLVPLAWFWIGRTFIEARVFERFLVCLVVPVGVFTASMGLYQAFVGFLPHQQQWIDEAAYSAVWIAYGQARAFSTFASGQEFAAFLQLAIITCAALAVIRRNPVWLLPLPLFVGGIFVQASRGPMVMLIISLALIYAVQARRPIAYLPRMIVACVIGGVIAFVMLQALGERAVDATIAPVVSHQVGGLTDPFNAKKSTASVHLAMTLGGMLEGIRNPAGYGLGATTMAAERFGGVSAGGTEFDVSNLFLSLGVLGGVLYLVITLRVLWSVMRYWQAQREVVALVGLVLLLTMYGQWLNGALYSMAPVIWLFAGMVDRWDVEKLQVEAEDQCA